VSDCQPLHHCPWTTPSSPADLCEAAAGSDPMRSRSASWSRGYGGVGRRTAIRRAAREKIGMVRGSSPWWTLDDDAPQYEEWFPGYGPGDRT